MLCGSEKLKDNRNKKFFLNSILLGSLTALKIEQFVMWIWLEFSCAHCSYSFV